MMKAYWKIGELAKRTGVSVRTLHHYDEIGLLSPSHRTGSGHRLYGREEVVRLQQILSLQEFIQAIEVMTMFEKYYTKEQLETLRQRAATIGDARIKEVEQEWPKLIADVRAEMQRGTDPKDPRMQALAKKWKELVEEFTGGDPGITQSLRNLYAGEPEVAGQQALDGEIFSYVRKALS